MSNSITYYNRYNVKDIYDTFKKNRVNKISLGATNEYISCDVDTDYAYIYARKSSPTINSDEYKNYAYLKVDDTTYNFYCGYAYTYTETVSGQNVKPILIAYDFVNQISGSLEFNKVSISHNATSINNVPQTVNVFSPVSYIIENDVEYKGPKNKYSISKSEINELLGGSTFADFTTYVSYSYLDPTKYDGEVYEDGKDKLSADPMNHIHVWSLSDGVDMTAHAYVNNDTTAVNAYTYLNCGNILNTFFRNNYSNIFDYTSNNYKYIKFYYDVNGLQGLHQQWKAGIIGTDKIYAKDSSTDNNKLNYSKFYQVCKVEKDNVSSFDEIYNKPSLRNNSDVINCYININGESNSSNNQESLYINESNKNKARFIKKISNLPQHLLCNNFKLKIEMPHGKINGGTVRAQGALQINKISVSPVLNDSDVNSNNEYIITDGELKFNVDVKQDNILYVTDIEENLDHNNLSVNIHIDNTNNVGGGDYGTSYAELNFITDNIYQEYENVNNTTIKRIDIFGTTDIAFYPSDTSEATYPDGMTCSFGVDYSINNGGNSFYTGDFHIIVKQTGGINQMVNESSSITFRLPIS